MWWPGDFSTWYEAHNAVGSTATANRWAFAEGTLSGPPSNVDTFYLVANTADVPAQVRVTLLFEDDGGDESRDYTVPGHGRLTVWVRQDFPAAMGRGFGAVVESLDRAPIVVERATCTSPDGVFGRAGSIAAWLRLGVCCAPRPLCDSRVDARGVRREPDALIASEAFNCPRGGRTAMGFRTDARARALHRATRLNLVWVVPFATHVTPVHTAPRIGSVAGGALSTSSPRFRASSRSVAAAGWAATDMRILDQASSAARAPLTAGLPGDRVTRRACGSRG